MSHFNLVMAPVGIRQDVYFADGSTWWLEASNPLQGPGLTDSYYIEVDFLLNNTDALQTIFEVGVVAPVRFQIDSSGQIVLRYVNAASAVEVLVGSATISPGNWLRWRIFFDATTSAEEIVVTDRLTGVEFETFDITSPGIETPHDVTSKNLTLASRNTQNHPMIDGRIGRVAFLDNTLAELVEWNLPTLADSQGGGAAALMQITTA